MRKKDDGCSPLWLNETDWLVDIVMLPNDWPEVNGESLDYIGRLFAFAAATDTRIVAQVGDPTVPTYELWFSFTGEEQKQRLLQMVRDDGYADPDDDDCFFLPPTLGDLPDLRPIAEVFPKAQCDRITDVAAVTSATMAAAKHLAN